MNIQWFPTHDGLQEHCNMPATRMQRVHQSSQGYCNGYKLDDVKVPLALSKLNLLQCIIT